MMYRLFMILALVVTLMLLGCASQQSAPKESNKVLLILRGMGKSDIQHLATDEAVVMKNMLEEAGFEVVVASVPEQTFEHDDTLIKSEKLAGMKATDYKGFILPCLCISGAWWPKAISPELVAKVKELAAEGKPMAAQNRGVVILAQAGLLAGMRYSYESDVSYDSRFAEAIYNGRGVAQDGNIITSAYCPYYYGTLNRNQTVELTQTFIAELKK